MGVLLTLLGLPLVPPVLVLALVPVLCRCSFCCKASLVWPGCSF